MEINGWLLRCVLAFSEKFYQKTTACSLSFLIQITWDSIQCVIRVCLFVCQDWDWVSRDWMSQSQVAADPPSRGRAAAAISNVVPIILVRLLTTTTAASFF